MEIDIPITTSGAFAFYTTYTPLPDLSTRIAEPPTPTRTSTYYIDVSPSLTLKTQPLHLNALSVFSVVSKFMGSYPDDWEKHLKGISLRGYNMVHFTPLMKRGDSNSPYSVFDQLSFDPAYFPNGEKDVRKMIVKMENEWALLGLTDVVWNHTANNSKWLEHHPEAGYNIETAPWLEAALELDTALIEFGSNLETLKLPTNLRNVEDLLHVMDGVKTHVIGVLQLWEFYVVDVRRDAQNIVETWARWQSDVPKLDSTFSNASLAEATNWTLGQQADWLFKHGVVGGSELRCRFHRHIDPQVGASMLYMLCGAFKSTHSQTLQKRAALETMTTILDELNVPFYREYDVDIAEILDQVFNRVKYVRLDDHGPKLGAISSSSPFIESYFTRLPINQVTRIHSPKSLALVNNGWIWAANAMKDHAGPESRAYLRREVIVWADCVKLRYGKSSADNPFLWDYMARYTRLMAKYFSGFRIDNCHSTPLAVAEFLLDEARTVRPNLAVFAELFTGSEEMDYVFVKRLGLSALIREAMQAWSTEELSRLVHRHGGRPIGSFEIDGISASERTARGLNGSSSHKQLIVRRVKQSPVHALFMDCTHDNEVPAQKRDARDTLPNAALVYMCACATGSVMGYDEIYPKLVDLVHDKRLYTSASSESEVKIGGGEGGIGGIKKLLNQIHVLMGNDGYDETHIHHEGEYVTVHRVHPTTRKGYFLAAHTAFPGYGNGHGNLSPVHLLGTNAKLIGSWLLDVEDNETTRRDTVADKRLLRGLPSRVSALSGVNVEIGSEETIITMPSSFPPGSIALFETWIPTADHSEGFDTFLINGAEDAFSNLELIDLNFILYRCDSEEREFSGGHDGVYNIPNFGPLLYAGLQGWWSVLRPIVYSNDLGHPLCKHLRDGKWALDYICGRLARLIKNEGYCSLEKPLAWLSQRLDAIRPIPTFLLPRYFALIIQTAYVTASNRGLDLMGADIQNAQPFLQTLAMVSIQQTGRVKSASLYPTKTVPCLAAGLPHFSTDWARCWGRDVFISLRGLFIGTGRHTDAREHILAFASVLKHGMIPNLLSAGKLPRYNSRDSIWFYLQSIQDYTKIIPDGMAIMQESVARRFLPYDDTWFAYNDPRAYSRSSTIEDIVQEAVQRHATGLSFREANAGPDLDMQMKFEGFQIDISVDWDTGIIFGGNQHNCGTWMDKMGESERAGSRGFPGTPRDGAAVEITGLLYSTLNWLAQLHKRGHFKHSGVTTDSGNVITFEDWAAKIQKSFEHCYYIPLDPKDDEKFGVNSKIVNRRGIYKDLYRSSKEYEDYQLRPNFPIAMTVAPTLFTPSRALQSLELVDQILRGPTGMATLDPGDLNYRPYYNNSEDSTDFATSKGRNYHQGPEWLWPLGFFLRALLKFDLMRRKTKEEKTETFQQITRRLEGCKKAIAESPWAGLTELTQKNGEFCADSVRFFSTGLGSYGVANQSTTVAHTGMVSRVSN